LWVAVRRAAAAIGLGAALATAPALGFFEDHSVSGDLDGDGAAEQARTVKVPDSAYPGDDSFARTEVHVSDTCATGTTDARVAGPQESLAFLKLPDADTRPGRELYAELRSGASGRAGEAHLVAWRPSSTGACGEPHDLFAYRSSRYTRRPRGTVTMSTFAVVVKEIERRFRGREVRLTEGFVRRGDAFCCPSVRKTSYLRYDAARDRYVRYRTRVRRLRVR
jgi:hypothetical protein